METHGPVPVRRRGRRRRRARARPDVRSRASTLRGPPRRSHRSQETVISARRLAARSGRGLVSAAPRACSRSGGDPVVGQLAGDGGGALLRELLGVRGPGRAGGCGVAGDDHPRGGHGGELLGDACEARGAGVGELGAVRSEGDRGGGHEAVDAVLQCGGVGGGSGRGGRATPVRRATRGGARWWRGRSGARRIGGHRAIRGARGCARGRGGRGSAGGAARTAAPGQQEDRDHDGDRDQGQQQLIWRALLSSGQGWWAIDVMHRGWSGRCGSGGAGWVEACRLDARSD